jgi:hypothetical protein
MHYHSWRSALRWTPPVKQRLFRRQREKPFKRDKLHFRSLPVDVGYRFSRFDVAGVVQIALSSFVPQVRVFLMLRGKVCAARYIVPAVIVSPPIA